MPGYWQHRQDSTTSNLALDLDATWRTPRDELRLGPKLHLDNTLLLYRWPRSSSGRSGIDSKTELSYDLTDSIRVGLRHDLRRNAVNLDVGRYSRLSLTTRVAF